MIFSSSYFMLVFIPSLLLSFIAQMFVKSAYGKWGKTRNSLGMTGQQIGERIRQYNSELAPVRFESTQGELTDHFDPRSNVVRMSQDIAVKPSVAAMAIVAHELGHAQQYAQKSPFISMRNVLLPAMKFSPQMSYMLIMAGLFISSLQFLAWFSLLRRCQWFYLVDLRMMFRGRKQFSVADLNLRYKQMGYV